ncbi:c-type cytochrome [Roseospira marina]|uniref:C-type cytochrome n=1 Tax=Roseospira marina TaxID=140057 RepID=A0A5M6I7E5_9PROT|nr:cytochrome c [Roseospira marina]KAA5604053.1 c-type cytochrome [Roseospira marina]MBB4315847.1 mono/diheme cytochrome c family protein [Roseospira marina]MBB5089013.1 mono/diheme cytochrome c family protein [Roseospira marina]
MRWFTAVLAILGVAAAGLWWFAARIPASPFDDRPASAAHATPPEQREYAARLADCVACHTTEHGAPFAGGRAMGSPLGTIYTTNITPDDDTGIGAYTLAEFDNAVRRGVARDGHRLYPAMPFPSYANLSDADVEALYDFFMTQVKPVRQDNRPTTIAWPLNMRWPLAFWSLLFSDDGPYEPSPDRDDAWNRGAYLVQGPGHCGSCHTPRGFAFQEVAFDESDTAFLSGALLDGWYAPSLRNDPNTGLGRWTENEIIGYLRDGRNRHSVVFGSMLDAFNNSTQFLTDADLHAIAHYLKSLPGDPDRDGPPWQYDPATAERLSNGTAPEAPGAAIYMAQCSFCHGTDGRGRGPWIPSLAGASSLLSSEPASAINLTLNGAGRAVAKGIPDIYRMPALRAKLSDHEIAEVLTFVRAAWGNTGGPVSAEAVAELREDTDAASGEVIILQMR